MVESTFTSLDDILISKESGEFICGLPKYKYFAQTRKKALIINVSDYEALRENEGKENFADLPETVEDAKAIVKGLKRLGFDEEDIITLEEPSWNELHLKVIELAGDLHKSGMEGERTLIFTYYAGHGMADNNT